MTPDPKLEKLRQAVIAAVDDLKATEATLLKAQAAANFAQSTASATETLKSRSAAESASERVLESAAEAEAALAQYREASDAWHHEAIQKTTVASKELYAKHSELQEQLNALNLQIAETTEKEQPEVDRIAEESNFHASCARGMGETVTGIVRLTQQAAAA